MWKLDEATIFSCQENMQKEKVKSKVHEAKTRITFINLA